MPKTSNSTPIDPQTVRSLQSISDATIKALPKTAHAHTQENIPTVAASEANDYPSTGSIHSQKSSLWRCLLWFFYSFRCVFRYANQLRMRAVLFVLYVLFTGHGTMRRFLDDLQYTIHNTPLYKRIKKQLSTVITPDIRRFYLQTLLKGWMFLDHYTTLVMLILTIESQYAKYMLRCMLYPLRHLAQYPMLLRFLIPNVQILCFLLQVTITFFAINSVRNIHAHTWHVSLYRYYKAHGFKRSLVDFISKTVHSAWLFVIISEAGWSVPITMLVVIISEAGWSVPITMLGTCMVYGFNRWLFTQKDVHITHSASSPIQAKLLPLHESAPRINLPRGYFMMKRQLLESDNHHNPESDKKKLALYYLCQNFERYVSTTYKDRHGVHLPMDDISLFLPTCYAIQRNETSESDIPMQGDFYELQRLAQGTQQDSNKSQTEDTKNSACNDKTLLANHSLNRKVSKLMHELWPIWYDKNAGVLHQLGIKRIEHPSVQDVIRHALRII